MSNSLDRVDEQRKMTEGVNQDVALVMVCMRRFGMNDNEIINCFQHAMEQDLSKWMGYLYPYLKQFDRIKVSSVQLMSNSGDKKGFHFQVNGNNVAVFSSSYLSSVPIYKTSDILSDILSLVIK